MMSQRKRENGHAFETEETRLAEEEEEEDGLRRPCHQRANCMYIVNERMGKTTPEEVTYSQFFRKKKWGTIEKIYF